MPRTNAQPVRLSNEVLDATKQACALSGRSLPMEIEHRLRGSLQRGAWAETEQQMAGKARAFGRLASFLANELGYYSEPGHEAQDLKAAVGYLVDRMYGASKTEPSSQPEMVTDLWLFRAYNSRERTYENGAPIPMSAEQRALAEIQSDLAAGRTAPAERPEEATTGGGGGKQAKSQPKKKRETA